MSRKSKAEEFVDAGLVINVTGRNVEVTDSMKSYALEKISKIERFANRITDIQVTMDIQKINHRVDILLKLDHIVIKVHAISDDMYISIDRAVEKLMAKICKYRDRIRNHHAKNLQSIDMDVNVLSPRDEEDFFNIGTVNGEPDKLLIEKYKPHQIVKRKKTSLKTLTYNEAIMKMELSGDSFLIFKSEDDNKLKVIYRCDDDNFGIIEVQN